MLWQYVANWHTINGLISYTLGDTERASVKFQDAIDGDSKNLYANYYLGQLYFESGDFSKAIPYLKRVVQLAPVHHRAHSLLASLYTAQVDFERALQSVHQALKLQPGLPQYHQQLGLIYKQQGQYQQAIEAFQQAVISGGKDKDLFYNFGYAFVQLGQHDMAIEQFNKGLSDNPEDDELHLELARSYRVLLQPATSIREYQKAASLNEKNFFAYYELAALYKHENKLDEANEYLQQALRIDPDYADIPASLFSLGISFKDLGQRDKAIALLLQALELNSGNAEYHFQLGMLQQELGQYSQALSTLRNAQQHGFSGEDLRFNQANALINLDRYKEARQLLQELIIDVPDHSYAHAALARIYMSEGNRQSAIKEFEIDIKLSPGNFFSHYDLGLLLKESGDWMQAKQQLQIAYQLDPEYPYTCGVLLKVYILLGQSQFALDHSCMDPSGISRVKVLPGITK